MQLGDDQIEKLETVYRESQDKITMQNQQVEKLESEMKNLQEEHKRAVDEV